MDKTNYSKIIAQNIRDFASSSDYSLGEIENNLDVKAGYFSRIVAKDGHISIDKALHFCNLYNFTINDLITPNFIQNKIKMLKIKALQSQITELEKEIQGLKET